MRSAVELFVRFNMVLEIGFKTKTTDPLAPDYGVAWGGASGHTCVGGS